MGEDLTAQKPAPITPEAKAEAKRQLDILKRGTVQIYSEEELLGKLERSIAQSKPLRIKLGCDPSTPDLHVGHTVALQKLRQFQDLGHQVIFVVGDFTAQIGDPSGKSETRKQLTKEEVASNARTYADQVFKIINRLKTQVVFNSQWIDPLKIQDVVRLSAQITVARMLERDDFAKRFKGNLPISVHEFLYPLMQAYDSVMLRADVELGGTDQTFNLLLGRELQRSQGQEAQICMTLPLLEGLDGVQKMSKSLGNAIGISEEPNEMFGKVMSVSDTHMLKFYELLTEVNLADVKKLHPRDAKVQLGQILVERFHSKKAAEDAAQHFTQVFSNKEAPSDLQLVVGNGEWPLAKFLVEHKLVASMSEARRLIEQGGVSVDDEKLADVKAVLKPDGKEHVLKAGKRKFLKFKLQS